jgi:hypothetical protein
MADYSPDRADRVRILLDACRIHGPHGGSKGTGVRFGFEALYRMVDKLVQERDDAREELRKVQFLFAKDGIKCEIVK